MTEQEMRDTLKGMIQQLAAGHHDLCGVARLKDLIDAVQASMQDSPVTVYSARDLAYGIASQGESAQHEAGYRAGYWQGYSAAVDVFEDIPQRGATDWGLVATFCDGDLKRWRYGDHSQMTPPPAFPRGRV